MKKLYLLFLASIILTTSIKAQKISVGFAPFTYNHNTATEENALMIYDYIIQAFDATQRFSIKDRLYGDFLVEEEHKRSRGENYLDSDVLIKQGKLQGAEWMVSGKVLAASATELADGNIQINIAFFVRVYDVITGEMIASEIINPNGSTSFGANTISQADMENLITKIVVSKSTIAEQLVATAQQTTLLDYMQRLIPHIKVFIREKFPFQFRHFDVFTNEFGVTHVRVIGNEQMGVEKDQIFEVIYVDKIEILGEEQISKLSKGELKIVDVGGKVFYMQPRNKRQDYLYEFIKINQENIFLRESGKKASVLDSNPFGQDPEKKKRRKDAKAKKKMIQ